MAFSNLNFFLCLGTILMFFIFFIFLVTSFTVCGNNLLRVRPGSGIPGQETVSQFEGPQKSGQRPPVQEINASAHIAPSYLIGKVCAMSGHMVAIYARKNSIFESVFLIFEINKNFELLGTGFHRQAFEVLIIALRWY